MATDIADNSIDLIVTSPPYNIATKYPEYTDDLPFEMYIRLLQTVVKESVRVLTDEGKIVLEVADSIYTQGRYFQLAGFLQHEVLQNGMYLEARHINFVNSKEQVELPDHGFDEQYQTKQQAHSNCHQLMVFNKKEVPVEKGHIFYSNYFNGNVFYSNGYSVPATEQPLELRDYILRRYFKDKMKVLDPFMGTAGIGCNVIEKGGAFYGYEVDEATYKEASKRLKKASEWRQSTDCVRRR